MERLTPSADRARVEAVRATLERMARFCDNWCEHNDAARLRLAAEWLADGFIPARPRDTRPDGDMGSAR